MQEMATKFAARGRSNSNREGIDRVLIAERPGLARKAWKMSELLWEKPFQDQDSLPEGSLGFLRMNYRKKIT